MSDYRWLNSLTDEIYDEVKDYFGYDINAYADSNIKLMEHIISTVLDNIYYGKYVRYVERGGYYRENIMDIILKPFPENIFIYAIIYKTGETELIAVKSYEEMVQFPLKLLFRIVKYVTKHRQWLNQDLKKYPDKWHFLKPSRREKHHEEMSMGWNLIGDNQAMMNCIKSICKEGLKNESI